MSDNMKRREGDVKQPAFVPPAVKAGFIQLFEDHEALSDFIMRNQNIVVSLNALRGEARTGECGPNDRPSVWLLKFLRAIEDEVRELKESIAWKWWKPKVKTDLENVRVELVDIFHFVLSSAAAAGMTGEDFIRTYYEKRQLNYTRQKEGFVEGDNKIHGIGSL